MEQERVLQTAFGSLLAATRFKAVNGGGTQACVMPELLKVGLMEASRGKL